MYQTVLVYVKKIFVENKITSDILKDLSEQIIAKLIPVIGPRAIFLSYWKKNYKYNPLRSIENNNENDLPMPKRNVSLYFYIYWLFVFA